MSEVKNLEELNAIPIGSRVCAEVRGPDHLLMKMNEAEYLGCSHQRYSFACGRGVGKVVFTIGKNHLKFHRGKVVMGYAPRIRASIEDYETFSSKRRAA